MRQSLARQSLAKDCISPVRNSSYACESFEYHHKAQNRRANYDYDDTKRSFTIFLSDHQLLGDMSNQALSTTFSRKFSFSFFIAWQQLLAESAIWAWQESDKAKNGMHKAIKGMIGWLG